MRPNKKIFLDFLYNSVIILIKEIINEREIFKNYIKTRGTIAINKQKKKTQKFPGYSILIYLSMCPR